MRSMTTSAVLMSWETSAAKQATSVVKVRHRKHAMVQKTVAMASSAAQASPQGRPVRQDAVISNWKYVIPMQIAAPAVNVRRVTPLEQQ